MKTASSAENPESGEFRNIYLKALAARELKSYKYGIDLLTPVVDAHPELGDFVKLLEELKRLQSESG